MTSERHTAEAAPGMPPRSAGATTGAPSGPARAGGVARPWDTRVRRWVVRWAVGTRRRWVVRWAVVLAAAARSSRDFGTRYALFVPKFLAVAAAAVVTVGRGRRALVAAGVLAACVAVSSLRTYPFCLPYANEAFGGPARTRLLLHDSNTEGMPTRGCGRLPR